MYIIKGIMEGKYLALIPSGEKINVCQKNIKKWFRK